MTTHSCVDRSFGAGDGGDHDGDGGDGGADGVKGCRLSGRGEEEDGPGRLGRTGCGRDRGIVDGSCPRTEVLKRRSHGIARVGGQAGRRCEYRREKKRQEIPLHGRPAWLWECVSAGVRAAELSR